MEYDVIGGIAHRTASTHDSLQRIAQDMSQGIKEGNSVIARDTMSPRARSCPTLAITSRILFHGKRLLPSIE